MGLAPADSAYSQFLRLAFLRSVNYQAGVSGFTLNQDGSAEFNNVTIRGGQIVSGTALWYSGAPALGNLTASIAAAAGTDSQGNAYLEGVSAYWSAGGVFFAVNQSKTANGISFWVASAAGGPWTEGPTIIPSSSGATLTGLLFQSSATTTLVYNQNGQLRFLNSGVDSGMILDGTVQSITAATEALSAAAAAGRILVITDTTAAPSDNILKIVTAAAGDNAFGIRVTGDTFSRFKIDSNGGHNWGPGNAAQDTNLQRTAAGLTTTVPQDANTYDIQRLTMEPSASYAIAAAFANDNLGPANLGVGTYRFRCQMLINPGVTGGTLSYQVAGSATASAFRCSITELITSTGVGIADYVSALATVLTSAFTVGANNRVVTFDGWIVVSAAGTLQPQVRLSSGSATMVQHGTFLEIFPVI